MSFDEKKNANRFRFNKEITLGDIFKAVGVGGALLLAGIHFSDKVEAKLADHDKRISANEQAIAQQSKDIAHHDTRIAILEDERRDHHASN